MKDAFRNIEAEAAAEDFSLEDYWMYRRVYGTREDAIGQDEIEKSYGLNPANYDSMEDFEVAWWEKKALLQVSADSGEEGSAELAQEPEETPESAEELPTPPELARFILGKGEK